VRHGLGCLGVFVTSVSAAALALGNSTAAVPFIAAVGQSAWKLIVTSAMTCQRQLIEQLEQFNSVPRT
jgi:hypothetical protein